jgi:hypothetical protein
MSKRITLALLLCAGVLALWLDHGAGHLAISNDACQYLDAAANLVSGHGLSTNLAHFDEQVAYGRFPVPFTHFAPGYPLLVGALSRAGMAPESAAWLIGNAAFLAAIWFMWDIGIALGARPAAIALFSALWITNAVPLSFASMAGAEPVFIALVLGMCAAMMRDLRGSGERPLLLIALGLAASASYWVRYAGVFLIPVALLYFVWRGWRTPGTRRWAVWAGALTAISAGAIPLRNILITGSWRGGFAAGAGHSPRMVAIATVKACYHIVCGDRAVARLDGWVLLAVVSLAAVAYFALVAWRTEPGAGVPDHLPATAAWLGVLVAAYAGGVALAALQSIAFDLSRYYIPVYPLILAAAPGLALVRHRRQYAAVALLVTAITAIQGRNLFVISSDNTGTTRAALGQEAAPGEPMGQWLRARTGPGDSIVSVDGQMLHYFVQRPVISIIEPVYSNRATDDAAFHTLMRDYHARFLVVAAATSRIAVPEQEAIPFLRGLSAGNAPAWLMPAARTTDLAVFECPGCTPAR